MKERIKNYLPLNGEKKRLAGNIVSLGFLQGAGYLIPLITLPYLVRVLGTEYIGLLAFATSINLYFEQITDYGFNLSATRQIAVNRENPAKINEIFSSVMVVKTVLMLISFLIMLIVVFSFKKFSEDWEVYLLTFGTVIGQLLTPVWLFQGMEKMRYMTFFNVGAKLFFALCIFFFVHTKSDYWMVPLLSSLGYIIAGLVSFFLAITHFDIRLIWQPTANLKNQFLQGWHFFTSRVYVNLYSSSNVVILGFMTNNVVVGYFSVADKVVKGVEGVFYPFFQALYPFFAKKYQESRDVFFRLFKKTNLLLLGLSTCLSILAIFFSNEIIEIVAGNANNEVVLIFTFLSISIITSPFGPAYTGGMLIIGEDKVFSKVVRNSVILNLMIVFPLIYYFQGLGLAFTHIIVQIFTISTLHYKMYNSKQHA